MKAFARWFLEASCRLVFISIALGFAFCLLDDGGQEWAHGLALYSATWFVWIAARPMVELYALVAFCAGAVYSLVDWIRPKVPAA